MSKGLWADVVVLGGGAAGMLAAVEAARAGADVLLLDKSVVGRGGATPMAQMTVAAAVGHAEPDSAEEHFDDTLAGGRGLTDIPLARLLCEDGAEAILQLRDMGVRWAADGERLRQVAAPGHRRRRCCYVDVLATGEGITRALRKAVRKEVPLALNGMFATELIQDRGGRVVGAAVLDVNRGETLPVWGGAFVLACGGLTEMYARKSASVNMTGDGYALALDAGAALVDMEMVQFFPIAHLAPRIVGLDPIMWDPFRYKLGGRLLNGQEEEFLTHYTDKGEDGTYTVPRDLLSYAILKEVEAGRGSPNGGVWLDFTYLPLDDIRVAFPPAVDRLLEQGIDLSQRRVEVAPMAHYTIGGIRCDVDLSTGVPGLFAAGEAVGGTHGANRLSGNAITEAAVFGRRAGRLAARNTSAPGPDQGARGAMRDALDRLDALPGRNPGSAVTVPECRERLQQVMQQGAGPLRDAAGLDRLASELDELGERLAFARVSRHRRFNLELIEYLEVANMHLVARAVCQAAAARPESRGAHQREDHPDTDPALQLRGQTQMTPDGRLRHSFVPIRPQEREMACG
jgi:succinate dehydrogenase / fumarate reductase, flavoprotein subunit